MICYLAMSYHGTEARVAPSLQATTSFLKQGIHVFSPLIYVNQIADQMFFPDIDHRRRVIMPYLLDSLKISKGMITGDC